STEADRGRACCKRLVVTARARECTPHLAIRPRICGTDLDRLAEQRNAAFEITALAACRAADRFRRRRLGVARFDQFAGFDANVELTVLVRQIRELDGDV